MIYKDKYVEGIKRCEINAFISLGEAAILHEQEDYRNAYFFGVIALEEIGKAGFIIEKIDKPCISEDEWSCKKTFMNHIAKIDKAKDIFESDFIENFRRKHPNFPDIKPTTNGWSLEEINEIWEYRNKILFVDYNFVGNKWESPEDISDIEMKASDVLVRASHAFKALESLLVKVGISPQSLPLKY